MKLEDVSSHNPEVKASFLSKFSFSWMTTTLQEGKDRPLEFGDVPCIHPSDESAPFIVEFKKQVAIERKKGDKASILRPFFATFGRKFYIAGIWKLVHDILIFARPLILQQLILFFNSDDPTWYGVAYVMAMFAGTFITSVLAGQYFHRLYSVTIRAKSTVISSVSRKSLVLSGSARAEKSTGQMNNLVSADANKLGSTIPFLHLLWSSPLQIVISLTLLYRVVGAATFAGVFVMVVMIPIQLKLSKVLAFHRRQLLKQADGRVTLVNEVLQAIRVVKLFGWSKLLGERVASLRTKELSRLRTIAFIRAINITILVMSSVLVGTATLAAYVIFEIGDLTPDVVFTAIALLAILRFPLAFFPSVVASVVECNESVKRIFAFLIAEELQSDSVTVISGDSGPEISAENATFFWADPTAHAAEDEDAIRLAKEDQEGGVDEDELPLTQIVPSSSSQEPEGTNELGNFRTADDPVLKNLSFEISKGELVFVVGSVGSGKTSLLEAILGSMFRTKGKMTRRGKMAAYAAQTPWIFNDTLRANITNGLPFDEKKFNKVVEVCALGPDIDILPAGADTEIGSKGVNLSGGQKARVSLGRTVYADADLYLLDDILSAVDAHVSASLVHECLMGELAEKTRVVVTNQLQFLSLADKVIFMSRDGGISGIGTYQELLKSNSDFAKLLDALAHSNGDDHEVQKEEDEEAGETKKGAIKDLSTRKKPLSEADAKKGKLVQKEARAAGSVPFHLYWSYVAATGGAITLALIILFMFINNGVMSLQDYWLSIWTDSDDATSNAMYYLSIYALFTLGSTVATALRLATIAIASFRASKNMHHSLFEGVVRSPMSFFDSTPVGRIINRFSGDIDTLDSSLPGTLSQLVTSFGSLAAQIVVVSTLLPIFLVAVVPVGIIFYLLQGAFRASMRELRRLQSISKSPVFAHFGEGLNGVTTIRAFDHTTKFVDASNHRVRRMQSMFYSVNATNRWVDFRVQVTGSLVVLTIGLGVVLLRDGISAGVAGLLLMYSTTIPSLFGWLLRNFVGAETSMNAVERISEFTKLPQEAKSHVDTVPKSWPTAGHIQIKDLQVRYREDLPNVLKSVSVDIPSGTRLGIVGRTGSGKSTAIAALFRLVEPHGGSIVIDGLDIQKDVGLDDVRSRISIVPQDAVLFTGTVRYNLDPFELSTDEKIWGALEGVQLKDKVLALETGLDTEVAEGGSNWSQGEQQLLCLARALLRNSKVIALDEASANIDYATEAKIQTVLGELGEDVTVITIAHRLNTVVGFCNRILVLEQGEVVEYDKPTVLLENPDSAFGSLVDATGAKSGAYLRALAIEKDGGPPAIPPSSGDSTPAE